MPHYRSPSRLRGGTPIVYLHSSSGPTGRLHLFRELEEVGYSVYAPDMPERDLRTPAESLLAELYDELGEKSTRALSIIGAEGGALAAIDLAVRTPSRVSALVLCPPGTRELDPRGQLSTIDQATLVLWGSADPVLSSTGVRRYADALPNGRLETLSGCGHLPAMERPLETAGRIVSF
ncbi:MAG TPA: alpha/beta hydrolase, partial [Acidimicrobiales bacterium]|nr:alpha/beta hydrolase [Acidimicrobiales bacterium]